MSRSVARSAKGTASDTGISRRPAISSNRTWRSRWRTTAKRSTISRSSRSNGGDELGRRHRLAHERVPVPDRVHGDAGPHKGHEGYLPRIRDDRDGRRGRRGARREPPGVEGKAAPDSVACRARGRRVGASAGRCAESREARHNVRLISFSEAKVLAGEGG